MCMLGEKPHKCDKCSLAFAYKSILTRHQRCHTDFWINDIRFAKTTSQRSLRPRYARTFTE